MHLISAGINATAINDIYIYYFIFIIFFPDIIKNILENFLEIFVVMTLCPLTDDCNDGSIWSGLPG